MSNKNHSDKGIKRSKSHSRINNFETGNRIVRGDHEVTEPNVIVLYRGIKPHTGPFKEQTDSKRAVIGSKEPLNVNVSVESHIEGDANSSYTSWTPLYYNANKFAGEHGIVMRGVFRKDDLIHPIENFEFEFEYSIIGTVVGTKPCKEDPLKKLSAAERKEFEDNLVQDWIAQGKYLEGIREAHKETEKAALLDPLKTRAQKNKIKQEYSPTGKVLREWEYHGLHTRVLKSGPGVPNNSTLVRRTKSSPNIKTKFETNSIQRPEVKPKTPIETQKPVPADNIPTPIKSFEMPTPKAETRDVKKSVELIKACLSTYFVIEKSKIKSHRKDIDEISNKINVNSINDSSIIPAIEKALHKQIKSFSNGFMIKNNPAEFIAHLNKKPNDHHYSRILLLLLNSLSPNNNIITQNKLNISELKTSKDYEHLNNMLDKVASDNIMSYPEKNTPK